MLAHRASPVKTNSETSIVHRQSPAWKGAPIAGRPSIHPGLEAGADGQRDLVARQTLLIVGVAIFGADIGLAADGHLTARADAIATKILRGAIDAVIGLEA